MGELKNTEISELQCICITVQASYRSLFLEVIHSDITKKLGIIVFSKIPYNTTDCILLPYNKQLHSNQTIGFG
jgi:hypothetical protein